MSNERDLNLSDKQQLLLSRYFDGECGVISRFFAQRLLSRNPNAAAFLQSLNHAGDTIRLIQENEKSPVDLWSRIDARIEQESRSSFYLGERRTKERHESILERFIPSHALFGGLSGAAIAAIALFVIYKPKSFITFSSPDPIAFTNSHEFQPVGLGNGGSAPRNPGVPQSSARRMEVDWMRSHGSLALIPDQSGSSTIIWVKRRNGFPTSSRAQSSTQPMPLGNATPTASFPINREWLDETGQASAK
jgi:hypothetical protein